MKDSRLYNLLTFNCAKQKRDTAISGSNLLKADLLNVCRVGCLCVVLLLMGCGGNDKSGKPSAQVSEAREYRDKAWVCDSLWQMRLAEMYYRKAYETMKDDPSQDWWLFGDAGYRYACLLFQRGDMEGAVSTVSDLLATGINPYERAALLGLMGDCQMELKQVDAAKQSYQDAYRLSIEMAGGERTGNFYAMLRCLGSFDSFMESGDYEEAAVWLARAEEEFKVYGQRQDRDPKLQEEYRGHFEVNRARLLLATGLAAEANAVYDAMPASRIFNPLGMENAAAFLMAAGRYAEAAEMYARLDTTYAAIDSARVTFDKINGSISPRYEALRRAGRTDDALAMADIMSAGIDTALARQKRDDAAELAVIYQTHEKELALEESRSQTTIFRILAIAALLLLLLTAYILWRVRRDNCQLAEKNRSLYRQIQEREQSEAEERQQMEERPAGTLSQNQQLYNRLCTIMEDPDVYTDPDANHETLARLLGTNRTYLADALHECAHTTPADFINRYRIRYAAQLLATTDDPVSLVAELCGIPNRSTFSRLFRDRYSMTPTEYRKAAK